MVQDTKRIDSEERRTGRSSPLQSMLTIAVAGFIGVVAGLTEKEPTTATMVILAVLGVLLIAVARKGSR